MSKLITTINEYLRDLLVDQYYIEMSNSMFYKNIESLYNLMGLHGFASFFKIQASEEYGHATKIFDYLIKRNEIILTTTSSVILNLNFYNLKYKNPKELIRLSLEREISNTKSFNDMMDIAVEQNDYSVQDFLMGFIKEQVEDEEYLFNSILKKFDNPIEVRTIDKELGKRKK